MHFFSSLAVASVVLPQLVTAFQGRGTWYNVETGNQVSCGGHRSNGEFIVALAEHVAQRIGTQCGSQVCIRANGREVTATIADTCPMYNEACTPGNGDALDLSPAVAAALDGNFANTGVWDLSWDLGSCGGGSPPPPPPPPPPPAPAPQPAPAPEIPHWDPNQGNQWNQNNGNGNNNQQQQQDTPPAPSPPTSTWTPEPTPSSTSTSTSASSSSAAASSSSAAPQRFAISVTSSAAASTPSTGRQNAVKQPSGPVEGNLAVAGQIVVQMGQLGYAGIMAAQN